MGFDGTLRACLFLIFLVGCQTFRDNPARLSKQNEACAADDQCQGGLACSADGLCTQFGNPGTQGRNAACDADTDCRFGLICNASGLCAKTKQADVGEACFTDKGCAEPLVCSASGRCQPVTEEGTAGESEECTKNSDCRFRLVCSPDDHCIALPEWGGVQCGSSLVEGPPRVLFDLALGEKLTDFFRLPFANDARRFGDTLDLSSYPGTGVDGAPSDLVGSFAAGVAADSNGFSLNSAVIFRFSQTIDFSTLKYGGDNPTFIFVDITPGDDSGRRPRSRFFATTDKSRYICQNWLGIRPSEGSPLLPNHTYAAYFKKGIVSKEGEPLVPDADFAALLSPTAPTHPALESAWQRYQPFRAYLSAEGTSVDDVIGGSVFTTGNPRLTMASMRRAVQNAPVPTIKEIVKCQAGVSPCAGGPDRACGPANDKFVESHAQVVIPNFLEGIPPFANSGGQIRFVDGAARPQRQEEVCAAITVPKGQPPAGGWPVVIFAHDVGGNFRSHITTGFAANMADAGWAVIGFDGVLQGARSGAAPLDEADVIALLDNFDNPGLMRDHVYQSVADLFAMTRLIDDFRVPTNMGNTRLNRDNLAFFGHGRGARAGVPFVVYEPLLKAGVFASAGGGAIDLLRLTKEPVNLGAQLSLRLADLDLNGMHPALQLMQSWLDPVDPVNYSRLLHYPPEGANTKHIFFLYGLNDTRTPGTTMNQLVTAARIPIVGNESEELQAIQRLTDTTTAEGNIRSRDGRRTQGFKQYVPGDYDGSEVAFRNAKAVEDLQRFFRGLVDDEGIPTIAP